MPFYSTQQEQKLTPSRERQNKKECTFQEQEKNAKKETNANQQMNEETNE